MGTHVYPQAPEVVPVPPAFNEAACVTKIIALRTANKDITRQLAGGKTIHISGGVVADVYHTWDEIEVERVKFRKLIPSAFNTVSEYKVALGMLGRLLDPTTWYNGLKAELGVTTWSEVVNATKPAAME